MARVSYKETIDFIWDKGNIDKNWVKHKITNRECEEVFFDEDKKISKDKLHSDQEEKLILLGKTKKGRVLYTVFTIRNSKVRIISSRDINSQEKKLYEKNT